MHSCFINNRNKERDKDEEELKALMKLVRPMSLAICVRYECLVNIDMNGYNPHQHNSKWQPHVEWIFSVHQWIKILV